MPKTDVVCIGNAIVDILSHVEEKFIVKNKINKGAMTLIDENKAKEIYKSLDKPTEMSGGSAANTAFGIASFGGTSSYIGRVADDKLGRSFKKNMKDINVEYRNELVSGGLATARCFIMITPDAERSMSTYLGASTDLSEKDLSEELIKNAKVIYLEGYLFDKKPAKKAFNKAADIAIDAGNKVSLTLSDSFCVDRHREDFMKFIEEKVDILFANEDELLSLYETDDFDKAVKLLSQSCELAVVTRGGKGSIVISGNEVINIDPVKPVELLDTTGAGDAYAAGFLYGYTNGYDLRQSGNLASMAASEVIAHDGARAKKPFSGLLKANKKVA